MHTLLYNRLRTCFVQFCACIHLKLYIAVLSGTNLKIFVQGTLLLSGSELGAYQLAIWTSGTVCTSFLFLLARPLYWSRSSFCVFVFVYLYQLVTNCRPAYTDQIFVLCVSLYSVYPKCRRPHLSYFGRVVVKLAKSHFWRHPLLAFSLGPTAHSVT